MYVVDDIMPLLLGAIPSFRSPAGEGTGRTSRGSAAIYPELALLADHLLRRWEHGERRELRTAFQTVERLLVDGDQATQLAIVVGLLEGLQNMIPAADEEERQGIRDLLGAESRDRWDALERGWGDGDRTHDRG